MAYIFGADFDLEYGQFSLLPKDCVLCLEVLFPVWKFIETQNLQIFVATSILQSLTKFSLEFAMDVSVVKVKKNTEFNWRPKIESLSFLLQRKGL